MGVILQFAPARAARFASLLLNRHSPQEIAGAIDILVDVLDMMGGDPDLEPNGDELDGSMGEDDFCGHNTGTDYSAGCPIADPGGDQHDGREAEDDGGPMLYRTLPEYGEDQSLGPINTAAARRSHMGRELGLSS